MELNGGNLENRNRGSHDSEDKYVPFDIENARNSAADDDDADINGIDIAIHSMSSKKSPPPPPPVSTADILKTLYNKTLLGDHMGRFPAPLLMNTVHFSMQAVLSTAITWYWSDRFRPNVAMSWRDYFIRVVPTALGTAFDVNLSNVSLVFISVTFATMVSYALSTLLQYTKFEKSTYIDELCDSSDGNFNRYQKLQKGQTSENDLAGSSPKNVAAKYVILDEMDDLDDGT
ncbi:unnamed protein product [Dovyalis caffra]|uniref:Uncharacterized protein n=1 Tax=Dovyalis caffra TaxID=77055 RepID=A0AAV1SM53_9ROSI|nr:unnamed protein product [Dovyalis caffra]